MVGGGVRSIELRTPYIMLTRIRAPRSVTQSQPSRSKVQMPNAVAPHLVTVSCTDQHFFFRPGVGSGAKSHCTFGARARRTDLRAMPSSAHHHYRSAPAHLLLVSATTAVDAFFTFPTRLASCAGVQQRQQQPSYPATRTPTATGSDADRLEADIENDDGEELRDCVIVGAGVAGLAAAADLELAGLDFVLLEAGEALLGCVCDARSNTAVRRAIAAKLPFGTATCPSGCRSQRTHARAYVSPRALVTSCCVFCAPLCANGSLCC